MRNVVQKKQVVAQTAREIMLADMSKMALEAANAKRRYDADPDADAHAVPV